MKPSSWNKQVGLASPRERAASQSDQTNNPSKNEVRNEVGLDVSHHARISQRGGEMQKKVFDESVRNNQMTFQLRFFYRVNLSPIQHAKHEYISQIAVA